MPFNYHSNPSKNSFNLNWMGSKNVDEFNQNFTGRFPIEVNNILSNCACKFPSFYEVRYLKSFLFTFNPNLNLYFAEKLAN